MKNLLTAAIVSATVLFPSIAQAGCTLTQQSRINNVEEELLRAAVGVRIAPAFNDEVASKLNPQLENAMDMKELISKICSMDELAATQVESYVVQYEQSQTKTIQNIQSIY